VIAKALSERLALPADSPSHEIALEFGWMQRKTRMLCLTKSVERAIRI
jgi:hypothetical protein